MATDRRAIMNVWVLHRKVTRTGIRGLGHDRPRLRTLKFSLPFTLVCFFFPAYYHHHDCFYCYTTVTIIAAATPTRTNSAVVHTATDISIDSHVYEPCGPRTSANNSPRPQVLPPGKLCHWRQWWACTLPMPHPAKLDRLTDELERCKLACTEDDPTRGLALERS